MNELFDLYAKHKRGKLEAKYKRGKLEPAQIVAMIKSQGGEVLEHRPISRLINSPFRKLRIFPFLYEFRVQYGNRQGHWYVRTSGDKGGYDWAWLDSDGNESLPVAMSDAYVVKDVRSVGWLIDSVIVFGLIALGLLAGIVIFLKFF